VPLLRLMFREQLPSVVAEEFDQLLAALNVAFAAINAGATTADTSGVPPGSIVAYGGSAAPAGWILCRGQAVSRATYADIFTVIGIAYGPGDGVTTFNLPNLQQRFPLGKSAAGTGNTLGVTGGAIDHTHSVPALSVPGLSVPALSVPGLAFSVTSGDNNDAFGVLVGADRNAAASPHQHTVAGTTSGSSTGTGTTGTGSTGGGTTGTNNPPYQVVNYIIKT
jgi:microcystin-dependent protein